MKPKPIPSFLLALLILALAVGGCGEVTDGAREILSYERSEGAIELAFEQGGVSFRATLTPASKAEGRRASLAFSSPESLSGLVFTDGDTVTAHLRDSEATVSGDFPLARAVFDCFSLLSRYESGALDFVSCKTEGDCRAAVFREGERRYELRDRKSVV